MMADAASSLLIASEDSSSGDDLLQVSELFSVNT